MKEKKEKKKKYLNNEDLRDEILKSKESKRARISSRQGGWGLEISTCSPGALVTESEPGASR